MSDFIERAKKIRLVIFDVDGVLTNGTLGYGSNDFEYREFNVHDGLGMNLLRTTGIEIAVITAKKSEIVARRMHYLQVTHFHQGNIDKLPAYEELKNKLHLTDEQIAYVGDDLPDVPVLRRVGLAITVADAPSSIKQFCSMVTKAKGGRGAAREVCDLIMEAQGTYQGAINKYLEQ